MMGKRNTKSGIASSRMVVDMSSGLANSRAMEAAMSKTARLIAEDGGIYSGFGTGRHLGSPAPAPVTPPARLSQSAWEEHAASMLGITLPERKAPEPPKTKRNWGELFRSLPDGSYEKMSAGTGAASFAGTRADFTSDAETYAVIDETGTFELEVRTIGLTEDDLRRSDEAVSMLIDHATRLPLLAEALELLESAGVDASVEGFDDPAEILAAVYQELALYPAIHFAKKLAETPSGDAYQLGWCLQWVYDSAADEDDDEEDD